MSRVDRMWTRHGNPTAGSVLTRFVVSFPRRRSGLSCVMCVICAYNKAYTTLYGFLVHHPTVLLILSQPPPPGAHTLLAAVQPVT